MLMEPLLSDIILTPEEDEEPEVRLLVKLSAEHLGLELAEDVIVGFILDGTHGKWVG